MPHDVHWHTTVFVLITVVGSASVSLVVRAASTAGLGAASTEASVYSMPPMHVDVTSASHAILY